MTDVLFLEKSTSLPFLQNPSKEASRPYVHGREYPPRGGYSLLLLSHRAGVFSSSVTDRDLSGDPYPQHPRSLVPPHHGPLPGPMVPRHCGPRQGSWNFPRSSKNSALPHWFLVVGYSSLFGCCMLLLDHQCVRFRRTDVRHPFVDLQESLLRFLKLSSLHLTSYLSTT